MRTIYKYILEVKDSQIVELPIGAKILTIQTQCNTPTLWALVTVDEVINLPTEQHTILCRGTGHPIEDKNIEYLGTVQIFGGQLVWHYFEQS